MLVYVLLLTVNAIFKWLSRRELGGSALLREMRASFYRKLFLAFVAAVFIPVVTLVLVTRNYVAAQMEATIEQEAIRTASAAGRVVEDLAAPRAEQLGLDVDDNLMVWVSRLIDQDVNMFVGARLLATSERNLFASGLLPTAWTPTSTTPSRCETRRRRSRESALVSSNTSLPRHRSRSASRAS